MIRNVCQAMLLSLAAIPLFILPRQLALSQNLYAVSASGTQIFKLITNTSSYNKYSLPPLKNGEPLKVKVRVYVYHLRMKETTKLDISMQILLELSWADPRLSYSHLSNDLKVITGGQEHLNDIWIPHVIFTNEKESHIMGSISKDGLMNLLPTGLVILTTRIKASMVCLLQLGNFPFDQQNCHLSIDSWRYNSSKLHLEWDKEIPLQMKDAHSSLAEFDILSINNESSLDYFPEESSSDDGYYSNLSIRMKLGRCYGYYFLNYYLPSVLLVIISWVSFWLEPSVVPARVVLGSSTMLTFIQLCWSAQGIQKVSQFMANDVWAVTCTAFIFLSLAEFAFVNTIDRKGGVQPGKVSLKKLSSKYILRGGVDMAAGRAKLRRSSSCPSSPEIRRHFTRRSTIKELKEMSATLGKLRSKIKNSGKDKSEHHNVFSMTPKEIAIWIDSKSRIVFPAAFLIFNLIYWLPLIIVKG